MKEEKISNMPKKAYVVIGVVVSIVLIDLLIYSIQQSGYNQCISAGMEAEATVRASGSYYRVRNDDCQKPHTLFSSIWEGQ